MKTENRPRIGFVGCGHHASHNLYPALRFADCELVAACDLWEKNRDLANRAFGAKRVYDDFPAMFAHEELDGVIVCGPPSLHYAAATAALERGWPVLVEKPPAESLAQMLALRDLARRKNRTLMVAFMKRFARYYRLAKAITDRPEFGPITHLLLRYSYNLDQSAEKTLSLMAIHALDLMRHFLGNPCQVQLMHALWNQNHSFSLQFGFASGAIATLVLNATASTPLERLEITGNGCMVTVDELTELLYYPPQSNPWAPPVTERYAPNTTLQTFENATTELQGYAGEVAAFIEAVRTNHAPAVATVDDGVAAMRLIEILAALPSGACRELPDLSA